jgi:tyrosyl-tRNA synthetase
VVQPAELDAGISLVDALVGTQLVPSRSEARRQLQAGGVYVNGHRADGERTLRPADAVQGRFIILRRGPKEHSVVTIL